MRVGYFIPGWPPDKVPNGVAATLQRLGDALEQLGHQVFYLTPHLVDGTTDSRVSVIGSKSSMNLMDRLRSKFDFEKTSFKTYSSEIRNELLVLLSQKKIDIFQMEETQGWVNTVAEGLPIPVVTRLHGPWFTQAGIRSQPSLKKSHKWRIDREGLAIRSSFAITAPSNSVLEATSEYYGKLSGLTKVIPNPIPLPLPELVWNNETCDKSTILFVGRFDEVKGGDVVLRAFSELVRTRPGLQLIFVGPDTGARMKNGETANFHEFVRSELTVEAASRIHYYGPLPRSEIETLRRKATLTVAASRYETFGNAVGEAMAIGSPIIATSVGGVPELLENQRNAILIEPANPTALASACVTMLDNPQHAVQLGKQARIDCTKKFNPKEIAEQHVKFYADVIEKYSRQNNQI